MFCNETALGDQAYVLKQHQEDFNLLKATCDELILDLAQAMDDSNDDYTRQLEFMKLVRSSVFTYRFQNVSDDQKERVICKLTGRRIKPRNAVAIDIWQHAEMRPVKRRFTSAYEQAQTVLDEQGDEAYIDFVDENPDDVLQSSKRYYVARKCYKFVKAFFKVCLIDLFLCEQADRWVQQCDKDVERAIDLLDETDEPLKALIDAIRRSHQGLTEAARKIQMA